MWVFLTSLLPLSSPFVLKPNAFFIICLPVEFLPPSRRLSYDVPPHLAQPCCVALGRALDLVLIYVPHHSFLAQVKRLGLSPYSRRQIPTASSSLGAQM